MKKLVMAAGAALVVAGVAAIHLRGELQALRAQNSEALMHVARLESANSNFLGATQSVRDDDQARPIPLHGKLDGAGTTTPTAHGPAADEGADPMSALVERMLNSAEGQEFQLMMMRRMLEDKYPQLAKDMNLDQRKAELLLDLLARRDTSRNADTLNGLRGDKVDGTAATEVARGRTERQRAFDAELKALLGDSYSKWSEYENAASARQRDGYIRAAKQEMRNAINAGGTQLTDAQFGYLDSAITAEQNRIDNELMGMTAQQQMKRLPETNRRLLQVASSHLNPQQLEGYKRYLEQQETMIISMDATGLFPDD